MEELAELVRQESAEKVIFDNYLKTVQTYNLAKATKVEVIDRFQLILEIFTRRATTVEAQMQIQLAKLRHNLTHAKERVRLARKEEQPGFMGLGAYEVDVYYGSVKREMQAIRRKLLKIREKRVLHRQRRAELGFTTISLAGYTNAGKSSLFNTLTREEVPVDTALFTTLSTTTRLIAVSGKKLLLTDTVGFIDRLPLTLMEAFRSTLEETIYSDLILLIVDASEPIHTVRRKASICLEAIEHIGASGVPIIMVLNKIDLISNAEIQQKATDLKEKATTLIPMSALHKTNLERLEQAILGTLKNYMRASFKIPLKKSRVMPFIAWLYSKADVEAVDYNGNSVKVMFEAKPLFIEKIRHRLKQEFDAELVRS